ncbi:hypothetical protein [Xanthomonas phage Suba]|uniref:Uncharacterized protein n=1 Tax=Xanthomonas phage Suba TaxID=2674975 RepID=A0A679K3W0_9CAUD|nr:hypothetical protein QAY88_gp09 [Xanthomonas phage Suba]CAA2409747.1 hypothetical protein [Xanthomonas phage Suba]
MAVRAKLADSQNFNANAIPFNEVCEVRSERNITGHQA